jgi:DNA polymerase I-like protein with 3'-5' exonuclease and polymerase domains
MRPFPPIPEWVALEHEVAQLLTKQQLHGWYFDERAAWKLASTLRKELEETRKLLRERHPFVKGSVFTPKRDNRTQGYVAGAPFTRLKELNTSSRDQIAFILQTFHQWKPTQLTPTGKPIIDEVILKDIGTETALAFQKILTITKMLGMISEGENAWLKLCTNASRIHHSCSTNTSTFRCSHRNPNLAQTPSDIRFRELFKATPGKVMVGADLSGIELRMLSHYLSRYDSGRYVDILLNGDIHQVNADKIGVSRSQVKTISYAFLYGAGNIKLGHSYDKQLSENKAKAKGKEIREAYIAAIPGLAELLKAVKARANDGFLKAIDGRKVYLTSPHCALNYLLQSSSAILAKRWLLINQQTINSTELCASQLAFIHDELQFECSPEHAADLSTSLVYSAAAAGEYYKLRCPIAAEAKQGENWGQVH